jgi:hypothetical protein
MLFCKVCLFSFFSLCLQTSFATVFFSFFSSFVWQQKKQKCLAADRSGDLTAPKNWQSAELASTFFNELHI